MGYACARIRQRLQFVRIEVYAMGVPYVGACPAQRLHICIRPHAVSFEGIAFLVLSFAKVGVQPHAVLSRERGAFPEQLSRYREGRAGGEGYLPH